MRYFLSWIGVVAANYLYQAANYQNWETAFERSFWLGAGIVLCRMIADD